MPALNNRRPGRPCDSVMRRHRPDPDRASCGIASEAFRRRPRQRELAMELGAGGASTATAIEGHARAGAKSISSLSRALRVVTRNWPRYMTGPGPRHAADVGHRPGHRACDGQTAPRRSLTERTRPSAVRSRRLARVAPHRAGHERPGDPSPPGHRASARTLSLEHGRGLRHASTDWVEEACAMSAVDDVAHPEAVDVCTRRRADRQPHGTEGLAADVDLCWCGLASAGHHERRAVAFDDRRPAASRSRRPCRSESRCTSDPRQPHRSACAGHRQSESTVHCRAGD